MCVQDPSKVKKDNRHEEEKWSEIKPEQVSITEGESEREKNIH